MNRDTARNLSNVLDALRTVVAKTVGLRWAWDGAPSLENHLVTLETALRQTAPWADSSSPSLPHHLARDLDRCITACQLLVAKVDADVSQLQQPGIEHRSMPSRYLRTRNLRKTQTMIQQQHGALSLLLTACNSASVPAHPESRNNQQDHPSRHNAAGVVNGAPLPPDAYRNGDLPAMSLPPSLISSPVSVSSRASQRSPKLIWSASNKASRDGQQHQLEAGARDKFHVHPVEADEKFIVDENASVAVETRDKFIVETSNVNDKYFVSTNAPGTVNTTEKFVLEPPETNDKFIVNRSIPEPSDKFIVEPAAEGLELVSDLNKLSIQHASNSANKDKWHLFRLKSSGRDKKSTGGRSPSISSSSTSTSTSSSTSTSTSSGAKTGRRRNSLRHPKVLLIGSKSRLHILAAVKMRHETWRKEYSRKELAAFGRMIHEVVRKCAHLLAREMRRIQFNPEARYFWTYVELIESYYSTGGDGWPKSDMELDARFFDALRAVIQNPFIADLVKRSTSGQDFGLPRSAEYFMNSMPRISMADYIPTKLDILYLTAFSSMTDTPLKETLREGELNIDFTDIDNLTDMSPKIIQQFEAAQCVVFVVDLKDCDDAAKIAEIKQSVYSMLHSAWFQGTTLILLINDDAANDPSRKDYKGRPADKVVKDFQKLGLDRLHVLACDVLGNGWGAIQLTVSTLKETIMSTALREEWNMLI